MILTRIRTVGPTSESAQPRHRPDVADRQHPSCISNPSRQFNQHPCRKWDQRFESAFLQRRVHELSVREHGPSAEIPQVVREAAGVSNWGPRCGFPTAPAYLNATMFSLKNNGDVNISAITLAALRRLPTFDARISSSPMGKHRPSHWKSTTSVSMAGTSPTGVRGSRSNASPRSPLLWPSFRSALRDDQSSLAARLRSARARPSVAQGFLILVSTRR